MAARPWIDAVAFLTAHGHRLPAYIEPYRPAMPDDARHALFTDPKRADLPPVVFGDAHALARSIHRRRGQDPIQLEDATLRFRNRGADCKGVSIWTVSEGGDRRLFIGWAWLGGKGREALQAALDAVLPPVAEAGL